MLAYLNNAELKEKIINQLKAHYDADEIIKGVYWENGKGCAVGCILHEAAGAHVKFESLLGIPQIIGRLIDRIFEGLPNEIAKEFPLKIMPAIPVGKDLKFVWPKFAIWLLNDIRQFANNEGNTVIDMIVQLYEKYLKGEKIENETWRNAADVAYAAEADAAAYAAAYAARADAAAYADAYAARADAAAYADAYDAYAAAEAAYAAYAAANAAAYAADAAAYAARAAADAAADAARYKQYEKMADKLMELVSELPEEE